MKDAKVQGYEFVLRTAIGVGSISRSMNNAAAFEQATKLIIANMVRSFAKRLEEIMFYGQSNIGVVASTGASSVVLTVASWAPGIWSGSVGSSIEFYTADGATKRATAAKITMVDLETRTLSLDALPAGTTAADVITRAGAGYVLHSAGTNEFPGLEAIMRNTGLLFGISAAQYDLWKSTVYSAAGADLSFAKLNQALAKAAAKGLEEDVEVHVNPVTWAKLNSDIAAQRLMDSSYKKDLGEVGVRDIVYIGQNGLMRIVSNTYVKESLAFCFPKEALMRVGSTDVTFKRPGSQDEYFKVLENNNGVELRAYTDQALFCHEPCKLVLITDIVNSAA